MENKSSLRLMISRIKFGLEKTAEETMTIYEKLIDLKYRQGVSTFKLTKRFPKNRRQIHEIALMGVGGKALKKTVKEKGLLKKILLLKKKYPLPRPAAPSSWLARLCRSLSFCL